MRKLFTFLSIFTSFNTVTEKGRTQERYRLALLGILVNILSSILGLLLLLITIPLTLAYLGEERFGVWMTIASLATMLAFIDMGIGNALISHVANANILDDKSPLRTTISCGLFLLTIVGIIIGIFVYLFNYFIPLSYIIKTNSEQAFNDINNLTSLFIFLFVLSIPLSGIYRVFQGLQRSYIVYISKSVGHIISIISIYILARQSADSVWLLFATYGVQTLMPLFLLILLYKKNMLTFIFLKNKQETISQIKSLLNAGGLFFILQIGVMIGWGSDILIISSLKGASYTVQFIIAQRLFQFVSIPLSIINAPLWAAYADAKARQDKTFIRNTLKNSLLFTTIISFLSSVFLLFISDSLIKLWINENVEVSFLLLAGFCLWAILESLNACFSMFLNGVHAIKLQLIAVFLFCIISFPLKFIIVYFFNHELIIWVTIISYFFGCVLFYIIYAKKYLSIYF